MNLSYCPRCGKLFARGIRDVCGNCLQEIEKEYEACVAFLKENKGATIQKVSEETGVTIKQITKFVREGRISTANAPNMTVPCEACGLPIREGVMCDSCRAKLQRDVRNLQNGKGTGPASSSGGDDRRSGGGYQIGDRLRDRL